MFFKNVCSLFQAWKIIPIFKSRVKKWHIHLIIFAIFCLLDQSKPHGFHQPHQRGPCRAQRKWQTGRLRREDSHEDLRQAAGHRRGGGRPYEGRGGGCSVDAASCFGSEHSSGRDDSFGSACPTDSQRLAAFGRVPNQRGLADIARHRRVNSLDECLDFLLAPDILLLWQEYKHWGSTTHT